MVRIGVRSRSICAGGIHQGRPRFMVTCIAFLELAVMESAYRQRFMMWCAAEGPVEDVVDLRPPRWGVAAREAAAAVAGS